MARWPIVPRVMHHPNKTTNPVARRLLCGPHQDSAREAESPSARSGAWQGVHASVVGQAAKRCSTEA